jgi:hypothetical protein
MLDQLESAGIAERFVLGGLCSGAHCALQGALADPRVCGVLLINLFLVRWSSELVAERRRHEAWTDGRLPAGDARSLDSAAVRRQMLDAVVAFDRLSEQGTDALLMFGQQEALYEEFAHHGVLEMLTRWRNLRLERIPSRDQMFRARWVHRHVDECVDDALWRMLARNSTVTECGIEETGQANARRAFVANMNRR